MIRIGHGYDVHALDANISCTRSKFVIDRSSSPREIRSVISATISRIPIRSTRTSIVASSWGR